MSIFGKLLHTCINIDSDSDIQSLFALFGAAYYHSESLHRGLCNLYALGSFTSSLHITKPRLEEKFALAYKLTLGQLVQEVQLLVPDALYQKLQTALEQRNFLAHHFWFERIHLVYAKQGIAVLTEELQQALALFNSLDAEVHTILEPIARNVGLTDEVLQESLEEVVACEDEKLMTQRLLKKQETIICIWDVPTQQGGTALIFETDDHELWQLCDVGLGWTYYSEPQTNWHINAILQPHLPASVKPRPKDTPAWEYEFRLNNVVLWVKPGRVPQTFVWGIR